MCCVLPAPALVTGLHWDWLACCATSCTLSDRLMLPCSCHIGRNGWKFEQQGRPYQKQGLGVAGCTKGRMGICTSCNSFHAKRYVRSWPSFPLPPTPVNGLLFLNCLLQPESQKGPK